MVHVISEWVNRYPTYNAEHIICKVKPYECISFDIFDTPIKRVADKPSDVFILAAQKLISESNMGVKNNPYF